jgi:hypothetical protein
VLEKVVHFGGGAVKDGDGKPAALDVEDEVLTHDGETHETEIILFHRQAPVD